MSTASTKAQHTEGPWSVGEHAPRGDEGRTIVINGPKGGNIADIFFDDEVDEANARLIAAAPELLEACKAANLVLLQQNHPSGTDLEAMDVLQAAIAKAVGQ